MRLKILALMVVLVVSAAAQQTPNLHLNLPPRDTKFWDVPINQNWTLLDNYLSGISPLPGGFPYLRKGTLGGSTELICLDNNGYATTLNCYIPAPSSLDASAITTGVFNIARIPDFDATKLISGSISIARLPTFGSGSAYVVGTTLGGNPTVGNVPQWNSNGLLGDSGLQFGAFIWGKGTGTLSSQSDLQAALSAKPGISGTPVANNCAKWVSSTTLGDAGAACGSGSGSTVVQVNGVSVTVQSPINFITSGPYVTVSNPSAGNVQITSSQPVRLNTFLAGNGSTAIATSDSYDHFFINQYGFSVTIQKVYCETDAGTVVINLQRDDGSPANVTTSTLTCSTTGASSTSFNSGENVIADGQKVNFQVVTPDGVAKLVRLVVRYQ